MAHQEISEFTDWLFNRFVESVKTNKFSSMQMHETLQHFRKTVLKPRRYSDQRVRANILLKEIQKYYKEYPNHKLEYIGVESEERKQQEENERKELYSRLGIPYKN